MEPVYKIAQRLHERRAAVGLPKYGRHLDADSPGCMIIHALEEAADQVNYLIAEIQRRREALELLIPLRDSLKIVGDYGFADTLTTVIDLLGGEAALAKYDEILGGGTVAENAMVDPLSDPAISTLHKFATTELPQIETITTSGSLPIDPRDEALRVATKLVEKLDAVHNDPKYELVWVVHQQYYGPYCGPQYDRELDELKAALAAIRAAGGAR